jgi:hypothetical protein
MFVLIIKHNSVWTDFNSLIIDSLIYLDNMHCNTRHGKRRMCNCTLINIQNTNNNFGSL